MQDELYREALAHFNEPVLVGFDLCRCVGYGEDSDDCYLIVRNPRLGMAYHTFVGGYTYLNALSGQNETVIDGMFHDDFTRLDSLLAANGVPREPSFVLDVRA